MRKLKKQNRLGYTLIEMLVVIATLAVLMSITAKFVYSVNKRCVTMTKLVMANQERRILTQAWRTFIHDCDKTKILLNDKGLLTSGSSNAVIENGQLILTTKTKSRKYNIPRFLNAKIRLDDKTDSAILAILELTTKRKQKGVGQTKKMVRIVAAARTK